MNTCPKCGSDYDGAEKFCPKDGTRLGVTQEGKAITRPSIPPEDPLIGTVIQGRYKVLSLLGEGGMGVVYVAEHVEIEKKVALKVLRDDFSKKPEVVARFRQEARSASKIGNAHIVDVTDFGQLDNGGVYFVMEYLQGKGLSDVIEQETLSLERTVSIVTQIARALQAAHDMGIVHRDLKPENIFLVEQDERKDFVKILDFGIAKISDRDSDGKRLTKTGMIFGTPEYMSPEQASGKDLDHRVDVYALGCIMFEMFTGRTPFQGDSFMAILTQHMFEPIPPIETFNPETVAPESVRAVVYKAMAKEKEHRYQGMSELAEDLERSLADSGYRVDYQTREGQVRMSLEGGGTAQATAVRSGDTSMEWTPTTGAVPEGQAKGRLGIFVGVALVGLIIAGGAVAYFGGLIGGKGAPGESKREAAIVAPAGKSTIARQAAEASKGSEETVREEKAEQEEEKEEDTKAEEEPAPQPEELKIAVSIKTEPEGAVILVEGMGQVCSKAPCEVELEEGKPAEVVARLDKREKKMTFTPSSQNRELVLELKKPVHRGSRGRPRTTPRSHGAAATTTKDDGLKIPGIFKDN